MATSTPYSSVPPCALGWCSWNPLDGLRMPRHAICSTSPFLSWSQLLLPVQSFPLLSAQEESQLGYLKWALSRNLLEYSWLQGLENCPQGSQGQTCLVITLELLSVTDISLFSSGLYLGLGWKPVGEPNMTVAKMLKNYGERKLMFRFIPFHPSHLHHRPHIFSSERKTFLTSV